MNIALMNDAFPPVTDGVSRVALNYALELSKMGDRVIAVVPEYPGIDKNYPFEVYTFRSFGVPIRQEYRWGLGTLDAPFEKKLHAVSFDIVHTHCPFSTHHVGLEIARRQGIPLVTTFHSKYRDDFKDAIKLDLAVDYVVKRIVKAYEAADEVWTVNEASIKALRDYGYKGDIVVMENGCDMSPAKPTARDRAALLREYSLPDSPLFAFIGRLVPQKNLNLLIDAARLLREDGVDFGLLIVGDGEQREELERRVNAVGLAERVRFAGLISDREKLKRVYLSADAAVLPSLYDTSSLMPREASACDCPVVLVRGSSTAQGITDGENGFLADATPESFAAKLKQIAKDRALRDSVARNAYRTLYRPWSAAVGEARERYLYLIDRKKASGKPPAGRGFAPRKPKENDAREHIEETKIRFVKMQGCGNDYIYIDCFEQRVDAPEKLAARLSDRRYGIGGDGLVLISPSATADAEMRMFNRDGSEGAMCGNALRCVAKYLREARHMEKDELRVETKSGVKSARPIVRKGKVESVAVDMGAAELSPERIPVLLEGESVIGRYAQIGGESRKITCVSMGNPHCVCFCPDPDAVELSRVGPLFEQSALFPDRVNAEFVSVVSERELRMRVWERGSGETLACGTGACAAVAAAVLGGYCPSGEDILVRLRGGELLVRYTPENIVMTGPAETVFTGEIDIG